MCVRIYLMSEFTRLYPIDLQITGVTVATFTLFWTKTYVVGIHESRIDELFRINKNELKSKFTYKQKCMLRVLQRTILMNDPDKGND